MAPSRAPRCPRLRPSSTAHRCGGAWRLHVGPSRLRSARRRLHARDPGAGRGRGRARARDRARRVRLVAVRRGGPALSEALRPGPVTVPEDARPHPGRLPLDRFGRHPARSDLLRVEPRRPRSRGRRLQGVRAHLARGADVHAEPCDLLAAWHRRVLAGARAHGGRSGRARGRRAKEEESPRGREEAVRRLGRWAREDRRDRVGRDDPHALGGGAAVRRRPGTPSSTMDFARPTARTRFPTSIARPCEISSSGCASRTRSRWACWPRP